MEPIYFRGAERLLIVISGLMCIILGYGLFRLSYHVKEKSSAEFSAKGGGFELTLRNAWPGVFFAAFGMVVLVSAVFTQLKVSGSGDAPSGQLQLVYQGGGTPPADSKARTIHAIVAIGNVLAQDAADTSPKNPAKSITFTQLAAAQLNLIDVAYGQGSMDKFNDIASKAKTQDGLKTISKADLQFYEDLRTSLQQ